ncbi:MAG: EamA family transporter [Pseudomonadota bacterium]
MDFLPQKYMAGYSAAWAKAPPEVRGILLMCLSTVAFSIMHAMIKHAAAELHPMQIAFFRNVFGFLVFLPILMSSGLGFLKTQRLPLHAFRGVINAGAMMMFFYALSITEVAHATALGFSAPIFAAVLSVVILGERFRIRRWVAIFTGFLGVLVILRPGIIPMDTGPVLVIAASFCWAVVLTIIKVMSRTESALTIVAYMNIFLALYTLGPAIWFWTQPTAEGWLWMVAIGVTGTVAQMCISQSLKETEPTVVMPFEFLRLIWVAILGAWIFGEIPDTYTWVGGGVVFFAGFYLAWRERQARRDAAASGT